MKKIFWFGGTAVVVALAVLMGPDLLGLYRLMHFVSTSSEAYQADGGPWPHLTDVCIGCHGFNGSSQHQRYPSLAGQPAPYIAAQLGNFASGVRSNPNMGPLAMTLNEAEIKVVSEYFARQPAIENVSFKPDAALADKGRQLVAAGDCAACHGADLMGHDTFPRLAGQGYDYLVLQLDAFAEGRRSEPTGTMKRLASAASPEDRKAISAYLASSAPRPQSTSTANRE